MELKRASRDFWLDHHERCSLQVAVLSTVMVALLYLVALVATSIAGNIDQFQVILRLGGMLFIFLSSCIWLMRVWCAQKEKSARRIRQIASAVHEHCYALDNWVAYFGISGDYRTFDEIAKKRLTDLAFLVLKATPGTDGDFNARRNLRHAYNVAQLIGATSADGYRPYYEAAEKRLREEG